MAAADSLPRVFGHYTLLAQLHAGVTGQSFLVLPRPPKEGDVWSVLKIYSPVLATPAFGEALSKEAALWPSLTSIPGVVTTTELGRVGTSLYRLSPYFPSKDAQKILTKCFHLKKRTPPALALEIAAQAALTLSSVLASPVGWTHRTLRPAHVLVGYDGQVKLLDYSAAKDQIKIPPESPLGLFYLSYTPPEIAGGAEEYTAQSDLFGIGVVLYELLTNTKLFPAQAPSREALANIVAAARVNPPSQVVPGISRTVDNLVLRVLSASPKDRFPSGEAFAREARDIAFSLGGETGPRAISNFLRSIFAAEIAQEEQGLAALKERAKSPPPEDPSPVEVFTPPPSRAEAPRRVEATPPKPAPASKQPPPQPPAKPEAQPPAKPETSLPPPPVSSATPGPLKGLELPTLQTNAPPLPPPVSEVAKTAPYLPKSDLVTTEPYLPKTEPYLPPVPEEDPFGEKQDEPSTNPLISIQDLRAPRPTPSPLAASPSPDAGGISPALARIPESQPPTPPAPPKKPEVPAPPREVPAPPQIAKAEPKPEPPPSRPGLDLPLITSPPPRMEAPPPAPSRPVTAKEKAPELPKPRPQPSPKPPVVEAAPVIQAEQTTGGGRLGWVAFFLIFALAGAAGGWFLFNYMEKQAGGWSLFGSTEKQTPDPAAMAIKEYKYIIRTKPEGASLFVNGKEMSLKTPTTLFLPFVATTPAYSITITLPGYKPHEFQLEPKEGEDANINIELIPEENALPPSTPETSATSLPEESNLAPEEDPEEALQEEPVKEEKPKKAKEEKEEKKREEKKKEEKKAEEKPKEEPAKEEAPKEEPVKEEAPKEEAPKEAPPAPE